MVNVGLLSRAMQISPASCCGTRPQTLSSPFYALSGDFVPLLSLYCKSLRLIPGLSWHGDLSTGQPTSPTGGIFIPFSVTG